MLYSIFTHIVDMSIMGSVVIAVVFIVRILLSRTPKKYSCFLWSIVLIRLICPVGIASSFSIYNLFSVPQYGLLDERESVLKKQADYAPQMSAVKKANQSKKQAGGGIKAGSGLEPKGEDEKVPDVLDEGGNVDVMDVEDVSAPKDNTEQREPALPARSYKVVQAASCVWLAGLAALVLWNVFLFVKTKKKVCRAVRFEDNVFECENIQTPFVLGFFAPRIYIPFRLQELERQYIILHEKCHIRRKDNFVKLLAFLLCVVHWFNPLIWAAYFVMMRDMEMSCDEHVLGLFPVDIRREYSESLLCFATNTRGLGAGMLAFGESNTRKRVKHIMKFRKAGKSAGVLAVFAALAVGAFCLTDANSGQKDVEAGRQKHVEAGKTASMAGVGGSAENVKGEGGSGADAVKEEENLAARPAVSPDTPNGADGTVLYYADEGRIIFGGYFGLFVYDTKNHTQFRSLDLKSIGCDATQGDNASEILVKNDGSEVYIHRLRGEASKEMYVYNVEKDLLLKKAYKRNKKTLYSGVHKDDASVAFYTKANGKKGYYFLCNAWHASTIGELGYKKDHLYGGKVYPLFVKDEYAGAEYLSGSEIKDIVKAEINVDGIHYVCTSVSVLKDLEALLGNGKKAEGVSKCPFNDVLFLTKKDGSVGMVIPAMDGCKACIMSDGYYDLENGTGTLSIYDMINKGKFKAENVDEWSEDEDKAEKSKKTLSCMIENDPEHPVVGVWYNIKKTMPKAVVSEFQKRAYVTFMHDADGSSTYYIGNYMLDPSLRLDFTYSSNGTLLQYTGGELDVTSTEKNNNFIFVVCNFAKEFLDIVLEPAEKKYVKLEKSNAAATYNEYLPHEPDGHGKPEKGNITVKKLNKARDGVWEASKYLHFADSLGGYYVVDKEAAMVVYYEREEEAEDKK